MKINTTDHNSNKDKTYYKKRAVALKCCVLIPTYNNEKTLLAVIKNAQEYVQDIIVINDGSTDRTSEMLSTCKGVLVCEYTPNKGKGMALRKGFEYAYQQGFHYAITMDSDGQHYAKDIPIFIEKLEEEKNAIIMGRRNMSQENVPSKSSFGNRFSSFWVYVQTGVKLEDTQTGYRLYPIQKLASIHFLTRKYEFEIEVLIRANRRDIDIISIDVDVYYPPPEERVTHFRPFIDVTRIVLLNIYFILGTLLYYIPRRIYRNLKKKTYNN
ncbi:MAG: glycosyltransferase family 2 protein [Saprospiraceae bacterium]|nr:glycosyltransferase family 2 protein [Saprospiraceae bacterium]